MKSNNKKKIERYSIYKFILLAILISVSTFGVFAQPSNSSEDFCNKQAIQLREKEKRAVSIFNKSKREWQSVSKTYPSNSKRVHKKNDTFVLRDEREALRLVEEVLRNGKAEDNFLRDFQWDKYENDVIFAFRYIKLCQQGDFQGIYRSLGKQRRETYQRLERIKTLSKKVEEIYKKDKAAFEEAYGEELTWLQRLGKSNPFSIPGIIKNLLKSASGILDISEMKDLLPRLTERFEVLAYLNLIIQRYESHLNMQDQILENLGDAYFERDCKKCKELPALEKTNTSKSFSSTCGSDKSIASSTFNNSANGWTLSGDGKNLQVFNDYITGTDEGKGEGFYFKAPNKFLGDMSRAYGGLISFERKQISHVSSTFPWGLVGINDGQTMIWYSPNPEPKANGWTQINVCFKESKRWGVWNGNKFIRTATSDDIKRVLSNIKQLLILGEHSSASGDIGGLRNVFMYEGKEGCARQELTGNSTIISPQNGSTVINEFDFTIKFDSVPEGVDIWSYTWAPLSKRYYFFPIDKNDKTSGSFTMRIKVTSSGDGYTFRRGIFLADECTSEEIRKKISGRNTHGIVYGRVEFLPKGVRVLQNIKETRKLRK